MSVYFIQAGDGGPIKIGYARDVSLRFTKMQSDSPHPLRVLAVVEGGLDVEQRYHAELSAHRVRGEWFAPHADVLAAIKNADGKLDVNGKGRVVTDEVRFSSLEEWLTAPGGRIRIAAHLGLDPSTPYSWKQIPARHVAAVARLTGIPAAQLRPDLAAQFAKPRRSRVAA